MAKNPWPPKPLQWQRNEQGRCAGCGKPAVFAWMDLGMGPERVKVYRHHLSRCPAADLTGEERLMTKCKEGTRLCVEAEELWRSVREQYDRAIATGQGDGPEWEEHERRRRLYADHEAHDLDT